MPSVLANRCRHRQLGRSRQAPTLLPAHRYGLPSGLRRWGGKGGRVGSARAIVVGGRSKSSHSGGVNMKVRVSNSGFQRVAHVPKPSGEVVETTRNELRRRRHIKFSKQEKHQTFISNQLP